MIEHDLDIGAPNANLAGTLCLPSITGTFPCVLMLPGSGPIDRDENIDGQRLNVFNSIAHYLADAGIASYRYDKRGCGKSTGDFFETSYFDFVDDSIAIFDVLKRHPRCVADRIFALGHSEGAITAMHLQLSRPDLAGIIQLCPIAESIESALLKQAAHVQSEMEGSLEFADHVAAQRTLIERVKAQVALPEETEAHYIGLKWFRELLSIDVRQLYAQMRGPILIIAGEKDIQCDPAEVPGLREAIIGAAEIHVLQNLTHTLRRDLEPASILRYPELSAKPLDPAISPLISKWIVSQGLKSDASAHQY